MAWFRKQKRNAPHRDEGKTLAWGGLQIPGECLDPNALFLGTTSSGKTLLSLTYLLSALCDGIGKPPLHRALVTDFKGDVYAKLRASFPEESVVLLNPCDARTVAWDIAADVRTPLAARAIADILVDDGPGKHPFFCAAVRDIARGVMIALTAFYPDTWDLNALLEVMMRPEELRRLLARTEEGRTLLALYFTENSDTNANIVTSIRTELGVYETAARLMARAKTRYSMTQWIAEKRVFVVTTDEQNRSSMAPIARALLRRGSEIVLSLPGENLRDQSWFYLDEVRNLRNPEGLRQLLTLSRSKGGRAILTIQEVDGLMDALGEHVALEVLGQAGTVALLRMNSRKSADWASGFVGDYPTEKASYTTGPEGSSVTISTSNDPAILPSDFKDFFPAGPLPGIEGVFAIPGIGVWRTRVPWAFTEPARRRHPEVADHVPWPASAQDPLPWKPDEPEGRFRSPDEDPAA